RAPRRRVQTAEHPSFSIFDCRRAVGIKHISFVQHRVDNPVDQVRFTTQPSSRVVEAEPRLSVPRSEFRASLCSDTAVRTHHGASPARLYWDNRGPSYFSRPPPAAGTWLGGPRGFGLPATLHRRD